MLDLAAPWKWTNVKVRRRPRTVTNMQHHPLGAPTDISNFLRLVLTRTSRRMCHENQESSSLLFVIELGSLVISSKSLSFCSFGRRHVFESIPIGIVSRRYVVVTRKSVQIGRQVRSKRIIVTGKCFLLGSSRNYLDEFSSRRWSGRRCSGSSCCCGTRMIFGMS